MPEDNKVQADLAVSWKQIIRDVISLLVVLCTTYSVYLNTHTKEKIKEVQDAQQEAVDTSKEVKTALNKRADKIDKATAEQKESAIPAAFGNWKWLENVASLNPTKENLDAADNAKRVYEDLAKKKN